MKQYQARTADLKITDRSFSSIEQADDWFRDTYDPDDVELVLVLQEWETEAEADAERVSYIMRKGLPSHLVFEPSSRRWFSKVEMPYVSVDFLAAIDAARNAPQPKVTRVEV